MAAAGQSGRARTHSWAWRSADVFLAVSSLAAGSVAGLVVSRTPHMGSVATPFSENSPWRQAMPPNPSIDPNSASMVEYLASEHAAYANLVEFGIPIFSVAGDTPVHEVAVECVELSWGICPFAGQPVFIPEGAKPNSGSDGALVTLYEPTGTIYEFWQARKNGGQWSASWGAVNSLHGSGWGGSATGAGASRLGGVIRIDEIATGEIPHALALQTNNACPTFRAPALKSDGTSMRKDCIPHGARLQLDPSLDLSELSLTAGELAVATAMQRYGGYVMDVGGAPLSVSFELDTSAAPGALGATYEAAGFRWDFDAMEHIPWERLRVLK